MHPFNSIVSAKERGRNSRHCAAAFPTARRVEENQPGSRAKPPAQQLPSHRTAIGRTR